MVNKEIINLAILINNNCKHEFCNNTLKTEYEIMECAMFCTKFKKQKAWYVEKPKEVYSYYKSRW